MFRSSFRDSNNSFYITSLYFSFYKAWTYNGTVLPNDAGAAWWGTPSKNRFYPAYWVGKTWIEQIWIDGKQKLKLTSYLMDETTKITDMIKIPF